MGNKMNYNTLIRISGMILLAIAVSIVMLALLYAVEHPHLLTVVGTIGWNGILSY